MIKHLLLMLSITAVAVTAALLPFLPGRYDPLAGPVATGAFLAVRASLLAVPVGLLWVALEVRARRTGDEHAVRRTRKWFAIAVKAFVAVACVMAILVAGVGFGSMTFGATLLVVSAGVLRPLWRILGVASRSGVGVGPMTVHLVVLPLAVNIAHHLLAGPAEERSRSRVIRNAAPLIADIERYRSAHGRYPASLLSVWEDYDPDVIGVDRFHYEPSGEAYNVIFEHFSPVLGTREFVAYNPRGEQVVTSHNSDLLQRSLAEQNRMRGFYASVDAGHPHWERFFFD